jgi:hypothetical protein
VADLAKQGAERRGGCPEVGETGGGAYPLSMTRAATSSSMAVDYGVCMGKLSRNGISGQDSKAKKEKERTK